jgi:alpha-tubulin suppressor-like RCC1 family protein
MKWPARKSLELFWRVMRVLVLALGVSAQAGPLLEPEQLAQGTLQERQRRSSRHLLASSSRQSLLIGEGGSIWVWGSGLGQDQGIWPEYEIGSTTPIRMPGMQGAVSVEAGDGHSLALMGDGTVQAWGSNWRGQLGDGTTAIRKARVTVSGLTGAVALSVGQMHSLAVREDGTVWAWGDNFWGQLGNGTRQPQLTPIQVPGLTNVAAIEAGNYAAFALREDGTVWGWGSNFAGEQGDGGQSSSRPSPGQITGLSEVVALSHGVALREDGSVWSWGNNTLGELGNGTQGGIHLPQKVRGVQKGVALAAAGTHSLVLRQNGALWAWGYNGWGMVGTGTSQRDVPVRALKLKDVQSMASHELHMLAVQEDGSVWAWGSLQGDGIGIQATPSRVHGIKKAQAVAAGAMHSLALRRDGTVWSWGDNARGQLGSGTAGPRRDTPAPVQGLGGVVAVAAGEFHALALKQDGTVWAWGANHCNQLGDTTLDDQPVPVQVQGLDGVAAIYAHRDLSVALKRDGTVWVWGSEQGIWEWSNQQPKPPAQVEGLSDVVSLSPYGSPTWILQTPGFVALRADGTVWQWHLVSEYEVWPVEPVEGLTNAVAVALSANTLQILRADGTVWNFGGNIHGEFGFPASIMYSNELRQVPGLTKVVSLSTATDTVHAVREDGSVAGWGHNLYGTIGDGISPLHLEPVRVLLPRTH